VILKKIFKVDWHHKNTIVGKTSQYRKVQFIIIVASSKSQTTWLSLGRIRQYNTRDFENWNILFQIMKTYGQNNVYIIQRFLLVWWASDLLTIRTDTSFTPAPFRDRSFFLSIYIIQHSCEDNKLNTMNECKVIAHGKCGCARQRDRIISVGGIIYKILGN